MTKVLVVTLNSLEQKQSYIIKLYGDPDQYAYKFENDTFTDELPIHMNWIYFSGYDLLHSISIDYSEQIVYFGSNFHEQIEYGRFIYKNETFTRLFDFLPKTDLVIIIYNLLHLQNINEFILVIATFLSQVFNKKLSYRRGTARCVVSVKILPIATQQCKNYLYDKS